MAHNEAHELLVRYCKVYSMWLCAMHPGLKMPTVKQRDEWHRALKDMYDYAKEPYPEWLASELKALK